MSLTTEIDTVEVPTKNLLTLVREFFLDETWVPDLRGDDTAEDDLKTLIYQGRLDDVDRILHDDGSVTVAFMGRGLIACIDTRDPGDWDNPPSVTRRDVEAAWSITFTIDEDGYATTEGRADIHP